MARATDKLCAFDGCPTPSQRGGYCWGHVKQAQRTGHRTDLRERHASLAEGLRLAAIHLADLAATDDEGWRKAWDRLRMAALRYARARLNDVHAQRESGADDATDPQTARVRPRIPRGSERRAGGGPSRLLGKDR